MIAADLEGVTLRQPPWSEAAEQSLLGSLLADNAAWDRCSDAVTAGDFYSQQHRLLFETIAALLLANRPADVVTVFERLQAQGKVEQAGGLAYLSAIASSVAGASNARRYAEIVAEKATRRTLIAACDEASSLAFGAENTAAVLDKIAATFAQLERRQTRKAPRSLAEIAIQRVEHYEALERGDVEAGWPTRIPALDAMLNGGLRPGGLYILAARPKVGKSSFSLAIAECMASQDRPTLVLSQEMPDTEVADRAVAHAGRVDYSALMSGRLGTEGWARAADAMEKLSSLPLYVDDQPALTIAEIKSKARSVKGLKVLVLDYLQLCAGTKEDDNRNAQIEAITRGLKALAKQQQIAVIALSQLNRDVEKRANKRPGLSDLRDSGAIEQDADVVMFLWPVSDFPHEGRKVVGLAVEANRQGPPGVMALDFHGAHQRWGESTASLEPAGSNTKREGFR